MVKNPLAYAGDVRSPGLGRPPAEGNLNPLQYFCLGKPRDRGAKRGTVHEVARVGHALVTETKTTVSLNSYMAAYPF